MCWASSFKCPVTPDVPGRLAIREPGNLATCAARLPGFQLSRLPRCASGGLVVINSGRWQITGIGQ